MRTQIAKTGYLTAEYISPTFWLVHPLPFLRRLTVGAAIEKNFFYFFRLSFCFSDIRFSVKLVFRISFRLAVIFISMLYSSDSHVEFTSCRWELLLRYNFSISYFRFYITTRILIFIFLFSRLVFTRINFDLFQHCRFHALTLQLFISLTLLLVINKHLCLCEFVLCLFWLF